MFNALALFGLLFISPARATNYTGAIAASTITAFYFIGDGGGLTNVSANAGGFNQQVQVNCSGAFCGYTTFYFDPISTAFGQLHLGGFTGGTQTLDVIGPTAATPVGASPIFSVSDAINASLFVEITADPLIAIESNANLLISVLGSQNLWMNSIGQVSIGQLSNGGYALDAIGSANFSTGYNYNGTNFFDGITLVTPGVNATATNITLTPSTSLSITTPNTFITGFTTIDDQNNDNITLVGAGIVINSNAGTLQLNSSNISGTGDFSFTDNSSGNLSSSGGVLSYTSGGIIVQFNPAIGILVQAGNNFFEANDDSSGYDFMMYHDSGSGDDVLKDVTSNVGLTIQGGTRVNITGAGGSVIVKATVTINSDPPNPILLNSVVKLSSGIVVSTSGQIGYGIEISSSSCAAATTCTVTCVSGKVATGGGCDPGVSTLKKTIPVSNNAWNCTVVAAATIVSYVTCGRVGGP